MKRYIIATVTVIAVLAITMGLYAQPAGGGAGFGGGGAGFGGGGGAGMMGGGGMDFGAMGGQRGGRMAAPTDLLSKEDRLKAVAELEKQVAALKTVIKDKALAEEPNWAGLQGNGLTNAIEAYVAERAAIDDIQATLTKISGTNANAAAGGRGGNRGGSTGSQPDVLVELRTLAKGENAKTVIARIDELIVEAQTRSTTRGQGRGTGAAGGGRGGAGFGGGQGMGMMGGGATAP